MTQFPQWATLERRMHLYKLSQQYGIRCKRQCVGDAGEINEVCLDPRHYYEGCAFPHVNKLMERMDARIQPLRAEASKVADNRDHLLKIQKLDGEYMSEQRRLQKGCNDIRHYYLHYASGKASEESPLNAYHKARIACKESWKAEDREARYAAIKEEGESLHWGGTRYFGRKRDPVSRDEYVQTRPDFHVISYGVSPWSMQRIVNVRIPSTPVLLEVQVGSAFQGSSLPKNQIKRIFNGQAQPTATERAKVDQLVRQAIREYWEKHSKI